MPDPAIPEQRVAFGTSGTAAPAFDTAFNDAHIAATTQADRRVPGGAGHPWSAVHREGHARALASRRDDRARGAAGQRRRGARRRVRRLGADPGRCSRAILRHNRGLTPDEPEPRGRYRGHAVAQSPPADGGFKYNLAPRRTCRHRRDGVDRQASQRDHRGLTAKCGEVAAQRASGEARRTTSGDSYKDDLENTIDVRARSAKAGLTCIGADPLGGASVRYRGGEDQAERSRPRSDRGEPPRRPELEPS